MESMSTADLFRITLATLITIMGVQIRSTDDMEVRVTLQEQIDLLVTLIKAGR